MEDAPGQSFIPKNTPRTKAKRTSVRRIYVFAYISYTIFIATLIAAVGVTVYQLTIESRLTTERQNLAAEQGNFDQTAIDRIREYDNQLRAAERRFEDHMPTSRIFDALGRVVVSDVAFKDFSLTRPNDREMLVTITGTAPDFGSVILQREAFRRDTITESVEVSEVGVSEVTDEDAATSRQIVNFTAAIAVGVNDIPVANTPATTPLRQPTANAPVQEDEATSTTTEVLETREGVGDSEIE